MNNEKGNSEDNFVPIDIEFQVDRLCAQFERECKAGEKPALRDYLRRVDARGVDRLLDELVAIRFELEGRTDSFDDPILSLRNFRDVAL